MENAIEHGMGSQEGGRLIIDINADNDTLNISITDNGEERAEISDRVSVSGDIQKSRFKIFNKIPRSRAIEGLSGIYFQPKSQSINPLVFRPANKSKPEHYSQSQKILTNSEGNKTGYQVLISIPIIRK